MGGAYSTPPRSSATDNRFSFVSRERHRSRLGGHGGDPERRMVNRTAPLTYSNRHHQRKSSPFFEAGVTVIGGGTIVDARADDWGLAGKGDPSDGRAGSQGSPAKGPAVTIGAADAGLGARRPTRTARPVRGERRRPRDPRAGDTRRQHLRRRRDGAPRGDLQGALLALGATCAQRAPRARGRSRSRTSSPTTRADFCSTSRYEEPRQGLRSPRPARTPTTTPRSPSRPRAPPTARSGSPSPASRAARPATPVCRGASERPGRRRRSRHRRQPHDDALASAWYRSKTLPVLVRRALPSSRRPA